MWPTCRSVSSRATSASATGRDTQCDRISGLCVSRYHLSWGNLTGKNVLVTLCSNLHHLLMLSTPGQTGLKTGILNGLVYDL